MKPNLDADEAPVNARGPTKTCLCLFINHSTPAAAEWIWGFLPLGEPPRAKSNLSTTHLHSSHIKCEVVETDNSISLFSRSLQGLPWIYGGQWEGRSSWFHATARLLGGGNGSLTGWVNSKLLFFTGSVIHKQCWEYSWLRCSVIDPLRRLLILDVTPSHPVFSLTTSATGLHYLLFPLSMCLKEVHV